MKLKFNPTALGLILAPDWSRDTDILSDTEPSAPRSLKDSNVIPTWIQHAVTGGGDNGGDVGRLSILGPHRES